MPLSCYECDKDVYNPFYSVAVLNILHWERKFSLSRLEVALCSADFDKIAFLHGPLLGDKSPLFAVQKAEGIGGTCSPVEFIPGFQGDGKYVFFPLDAVCAVLPQTTIALHNVKQWITFDIPLAQNEWAKRIADVYVRVKDFTKYGISIDARCNP